MKKEKVEKIYSLMLLIRRTEEKLLELFSRGLLNGTVHTCIGQEACAVGVMEVIDKEIDIIFSNHRAHGHFLAYSEDVYGLLAEVIGKKSGLCGGIGGSQHLHKKNFYTNGIQGGIVPIALGAAKAEKFKGSKAIVIVFLGDGTMGQGVVYESLNIASLWSLPLLFILEDNHYAQTTPKKLAHAGSFCQRAKAFDIQTEHIKVDDVLKLINVADNAVRYVRENKKPFFLHMETYRFSPHSKGDDYRNAEEIAKFKLEDPLIKLEKELSKEKVKEISENIDNMLLSILNSINNDNEMSLEELLILNN